MKYITTSLATDWPKDEPWQVKVMSALLFFIPKANPDYDSKMHLVKKWLVEFVEEEGSFVPWREVALSAEGEPVFAGPDKRNYGFWLDTNMKLEDFEGKMIEKQEFEHYWKKSGVQELQID